MTAPRTSFNSPRFLIDFYESGGTLFQPGDEIDIWKVEKALGAGGMGSVYRCHNRSAKRILAAIKVLDVALTRHASIRSRFIREAEILFSLDHPHIVKVRNVRIDAEPPYLEMEFVEGESLEARLSRGPLPVGDALKLGTQIADALVYLHARGIRHRDIKPSNILVQRDGNAKLVDFGIATESDGATLSEGGQVFGSVAFVPPEWARPGELDPVLWDIYALGICLFEALTGQVAFDISANGSPSQRFFQVIMAKQCHPPLDLGSTFPEPLRALVRTMTDSDAKRRPQTAAEVLRELKRLDPLGMVRSERSPAHADTVPDTVHEVAIPPRRSDPTWAEPAPPNRTIAPATPEKPRSRIPVFAAAAFAVASFLLVISLLAWNFLPTASPTLLVQPSGGYPAELSLDGLPGTVEADGSVRFERIKPGSHALHARLGKDCEVSPLTCGEANTTVEITEKPGIQTFPWAIAGPPTRPVTLSAEADPFQVVVDGKDLGSGGPFRFDSLPGRLQIRAVAGNCPADTPSCDKSSCPEGCAVWEGRVEVPWGEGPIRVEVPLVAPTVKAATEVPPTRPPVDPVKPVTSHISFHGPVSNAQLAKWLKSHAEWQKDAMITAGKADSHYLSGWDGASPPSGKEGLAAVGVSWNLAKAYCAGRGGLALVDADPKTWSESPTSPWHEYRQQDGRPAWRRSDGSVSIAVNPTESKSYIGFRCVE